MFINPMWNHESERVGKQRCTPLGYALHVISDWIGLMGIVSIFVVAAFLIQLAIQGMFRLTAFALFLLPLVLGIGGSVLYRISWMLARRRGFVYDQQSRTASWLHRGLRHVYCHSIAKDMEAMVKADEEDKS